MTDQHRDEPTGQLDSIDWHDTPQEDCPLCALERTGRARGRHGFDGHDRVIIDPASITRGL